MQAKEPLSVDVLVTLHDTPNAGGHVKTWKHLATEAAEVESLDLTLFMLGNRHATTPLSETTRRTTFRPVISTGHINEDQKNIGQTDIAPFHPGLARALRKDSVWHATDTFSFSQTARLLTHPHDQVLIASHHTDVPELARNYSRRIVTDWLGQTVGKRILLDNLHADERIARLARLQTHRIWKKCMNVLVSNDHDEMDATNVLGDSARVARLRRGIDRTTFNDGLRDRLWLKQSYGIPSDMPVIMFAGRIDTSKGIPILTQAVRLLIENGDRLHLMCAGEGDMIPVLKRTLGQHVSTPGYLPQDELGRLYANADIFAFPSRSETIGNVVAEAMSCGTPAVLPTDTATTQWLKHPGMDGLLVPDDSPETWAKSLHSLLENKPMLTTMSRQAYATSLLLPTWSEVLHEDLLPIWQRAAKSRNNS